VPIARKRDCTEPLLRKQHSWQEPLVWRNNKPGGNQHYLPFNNRSLCDLNEIAETCSSRIDDICSDDEFHLAVAVTSQLSGTGIESYRDPPACLDRGGKACCAMDIGDFWKQARTRFLKFEVFIAIPQVVNDSDIAVGVYERVSMKFLVVCVA